MATTAAAARPDQRSPPPRGTVFAATSTACAPSRWRWSWPSISAAAMSRGGFAGVDVFFVISGYLMTRIIVGGLRGRPLRPARFLPGPGAADRAGAGGVLRRCCGCSARRCSIRGRSSGWPPTCPYALAVRLEHRLRGPRRLLRRGCARQLVPAHLVAVGGVAVLPALPAAACWRCCAGRRRGGGCGRSSRLDRGRLVRAGAGSRCRTSDARLLHAADPGLGAAAPAASACRWSGGLALGAGVGSACTSPGLALIALGVAALPAGSPWPSALTLAPVGGAALVIVAGARAHLLGRERARAPASAARPTRSTSGTGRSSSGSTTTGSRVSWAVAAVALAGDDRARPRLLLADRAAAHQLALPAEAVAMGAGRRRGSRPRWRSPSSPSRPTAWRRCARWARRRRSARRWPTTGGRWRLGLPAGLRPPLEPRACWSSASWAIRRRGRCC